MADLRVAEREGIGVDRMVREMVRVGHHPPDIREISGPLVRASLVGDAVDEAWIRWLRSLEPADESQDLNSLLLLRQLVLQGWTDVTRLAPLVQLTVEEARGVTSKLAKAKISGQSAIRLVDGVPSGSEPSWRLSGAARNALVARDREHGNSRAWPKRDEIARDYARARGRISTTELGSIVGASPMNVGGILKALETQGEIAPAWPSRRGKGFFYKSLRHGAPTVGDDA